jgi:hypothetical protein
MLKFSDSVSPGNVIAIGDIHGTWEPYSQFLDWIRDSGAVIVSLGDLIDRGADDLKVLETSKALNEDPESWGLSSYHVLKGNHEKMFLDSFYIEDGKKRLFFQSAVEWFTNGGSEANAQEMADKYYEWVSDLPILLKIGETIFVHGGTPPGKDPEVSIMEGRPDILLWMREPFLRYGPQLEKWTDKYKRVVHGHTPTIFEEGGISFLPVQKDQRVNIDTGAFIKINSKGEVKHGRLTAYNVTQNTFKQFSVDPNETFAY